MPLFSVVIPVYNRGELVDAALQSVFAQTCKDYEIIVVDDGSTDDTAAVLKTYGERIKVFRQANQGPGAARNLGLANASGTYCAFLDSDDVWFPWTLETYAEVIERFKEPSVMICTCFSWKAEAELGAVKQTPLEVERYADYLASTDRFFYRGTNVLAVRTDELRKINGFTHERINGEDHDLLYRLGVAAGFAWIRSPVLVGYRIHAGSIQNDFAKTINGMLFLIRQEIEHKYPGGKARKRDRIRLLAHSLRYVAWVCLSQRYAGYGIRLYWLSLGWNLQTKRLTFIMGYPVLAALTAMGLYPRHNAARG